MIRTLGRFFIRGFLLTIGFGIFGDYARDMVLLTAVALGLYMPLTLVSIATWRATRGEDPEDMIRVFGTDAPKIISSFHETYRQNKTAVLGTTVLTWLGCGGLLGLWFSWALPGAWSMNPGLLLTLTVGASLCGALAGPGLAVVVLSILRGNASGSTPADA